MKMANASASAGLLLSLDEQEAVRRQISYIAASPLFRNSKRFPDFLRYTVEEALNGNYTDLKERMIGIEVFGRDPNYDTNSDPVVRMTAVEVRKRLAQYYQQAHRDQVRIEVLPGSYMPQFRRVEEHLAFTAPAAHPMPLRGVTAPPAAKQPIPVR